MSAACAVFAGAHDPKLGVVDSAKLAKAKSSTPRGFTDDLDKAFAKAKTEGKLVYACFSGSDWCGWCMKLEREVLSKQEFVDGVKNDFVLVFIDSPRNKEVLSEHAKAANELLVKKYWIDGFPRRSSSTATAGKSARPATGRAAPRSTPSI